MKKLILASFLLLPFTFAFSAIEKPKLILVISIDQFRADYLERFKSHFLPAKGSKIGGFNYLKTKGAYFSHAEFGLLQNMTCPGHATILTGAYAYQTGIPNNDWYNPETGAFIYCAEDQSHKTIGASPKNPHVGTSPKNLKTNTFGDELKNAYTDSRVVSIALKDRSAIMLGGHRADVAFWFDGESFQWVSSEYYLKEIPAWVAQINQGLKSKIGNELVWDKKLDKTIRPNTQILETKQTKEMGASFTHRASVGVYSSLLFPIGISMPVEMAEAAITNLKLGQGKATDILAMSFSSHDYVGHTFGPESDEIKETTVLEDQILSRLLNFVNNKIPGGLENTWIVLTADHGVAWNPQIQASLKVPAGYLDQELVVKEIEKFMNEKYGKVSGKWTLEPSELNFFFNPKSIAEKELDITKVRSEVMKYLIPKQRMFKGIAHIFSGNDVKRRTLPPGQFEKQILRTYFEGRSGDIVMIQEPGYIVAYGASSHLSGYSYDRYVPVIFTGKPFRPGLYAGGEVVDIAPTLSFLMGIIPPASSEGKILKEALLDIR